MTTSLLTTTSGDSRTHPWTWVALAIILLVAGAARFIDIGGPVYELDEYWHAELSTGRGSAQNHLPHNQIFEIADKVTGLKDAPPVWKIWTHMEQTVHPPLYPMALRLWRDVFGEDAGESRALGASASIISILLLFDLARRMHGTTTGLWSAAIFAVSSPQISLARTLRGYTFGLMLVLAVAWIAVRLIDHPPPRIHALLIALCALTAASLLTYYFTLFPLAAIGLYAIVRARGSSRRKIALAMILGVMIFALSWAPGILEQRKTLPAPTDKWIYDGTPGHASRVLMWAASLPSRMLFEPRKDAKMFALLGAVLYFVPIFLLRRRPRVSLWLIWLWFTMLPLVAMDLLRGSKHISFERYTLAAGPPVFVLLATLLQSARYASLRQLLPICTFIACILSIGSAYEDPRVHYDEMANFIDSHETEPEPVIVYSQGTSWFGNAVFLTLSHESRRYPWPMLLSDDAPIQPKLIAQLRARSGRAWIISQGQTPSPDELIPGAKLIEWIYIPSFGVAWHVSLPGSSPS